MKTTAFPLILFLAFAACSKQTEVVTESTALQVEKVRMAPDYDAARQMFRQLQPAAAAFLWVKHVNEYKNLNSIRKNPDKQAAIDALLTHIRAGIFVRNSKEAVIFLNYTFPAWLSLHGKRLSQRELYDLCFDPLQLSSMEAGQEYELEDAANAPCFCHIGNSGYSCKKLSIGIPSGVTVEYGICESGSDCAFKTIGCGVFWLESCNGSHCSF